MSLLSGLKECVIEPSYILPLRHFLIMIQFYFKLQEIDRQRQPQGLSLHLYPLRRCISTSNIIQLGYFLYIFFTTFWRPLLAQIAARKSVLFPNPRSGQVAFQWPPLFKTLSPMALLYSSADFIKLSYVGRECSTRCQLHRISCDKSATAVVVFLPNQVISSTVKTSHLGSAIVYQVMTVKGCAAILHFLLLCYHPLNTPLRHVQSYRSKQ